MKFWGIPKLSEPTRTTPLYATPSSGESSSLRSRGLRRSSLVQLESGRRGLITAPLRTKQEPGQPGRVKAQRPDLSTPAPIVLCHVWAPFLSLDGSRRGRVALSLRRTPAPTPARDPGPPLGSGPTCVVSPARTRAGGRARAPPGQPA